MLFSKGFWTNLYLENQTLLGECFKGGGQVVKPQKNIKMAMLNKLHHHETLYKTD